MRETVTIGGRSFPVVSSSRSSPVRRSPRRMSPPPCGQPREQGTLKLSIVPPSVNALFFNRRRGRGKTLAYRTWRAGAHAELEAQPAWHVPGKIEVRIYLAAHTQGDADNRIKATLDALVTAGRIKDDRNVIKISAEYAHLDEGIGALVLIQARPA